MKNISSITIAILASLAFAGSTMAAGEYGQKEKSQTQTQTQIQPGQQQQIRNASDIQNFNVQTASGEKLGKVDKVVVDLQQGQIGYVIVAAEEGGDKYIVPWKAVRSDAQQQTLVLSLSQDMLKQAPKGDLQQVMDRQKGREIHQFYGVAPYWEQSGSQQPGMQQRMQERMHQPGSMQMERETKPRPGSGM